MKRKYLEDLGIRLDETPYGWCPNDSRQEFWNREQEEYGFDERETWSLNSTFFYWLYERLMKYNEINIVNTSFHRFNINGVDMTQQECIDKMIDLCKRYITYEYKGLEDENRMLKETEEVFDILKQCIWALWW